jgi:ribosome biogenesis GTPase / thiamine phosphate phosphatase
MNTRNTNTNEQGVVVRKTVGSYEVNAGGRILSCTLTSLLRKQLIYPIADPTSLRHVVMEVKSNEHFEPVVVGDEVRIVDLGGGSGQIVAVLPRRNRLARRSPVPMPSAHPFEQVIVANLDQVVPVFSAAAPPPKWNLLDRTLASSESLDLPALICITKMDLVQSGVDSKQKELEAELEEYRTIGYPVVLTSSISGEGIPALKQALAGRVSGFLGKSGVGKTALLNAIQPGLGLRVKAVSQATGKGRHTTTNVEMIPLEIGGAVMDTPGIREFGLWDVDDDNLALFFREMRPLVGSCKFGLDCRHDVEPGCAIRKAVQDGEISPRRYQSFLRLKEEIRFV